MKLSFYLEQRVRKKDAKAGIYVSISSHLGRIRKATGIYIKPEAWDKTKQQINRKEPFNVILNAKLNNISKVLHEGFALRGRQLKELDVELLLVEATEGKEAVNELLQQSTATDNTFVNWCEQLIEKKKDELSKNSLLAIKHIANIVDGYESKISLTSMNEEWLAQFRSWLVKRGLHNHTINIYLSRVHKVLKEAYIFGNTDHEPIKIKSLKTKESVIIYLNSEELKAFEATDAVINSKLLGTMQVAKDYFLFMCYTGLRYSDFTTLRPENVKLAVNKSKYDKYLHYVCQKNNVEVTCPLHSKAIAIIDKYQGKDNSLLFPVLKKTAFIYNIKKHAQNAGINTPVLDSYYVGNVLRQEQVPKYQLLSPHAARHTFATNYIANGGNIVYLQKLMGHKNLNMTQSYVEILKPNMEDDFYSAFGK